VETTSALSCACDRSSFFHFFLTRSSAHHFFFVPPPHSQDVALVRMYRDLSRRIVKDGDHHGLKCTPVPWGGAWEVEKWLLDNK
jgi:hypothetical protein